MDYVLKVDKICNSFYEGCEAVGTQDQTTLSVTDLTKLTPLLEAYEKFGEELRFDGYEEYSEGIIAIYV